VKGSNAAADFSGFIREIYNAGISFNRPRYSVKLNWNHKGLQKQGLQFGPDYYNYAQPKNYVDLNFEYRMRKNLSVFLSVRNLFEQWEQGDRYNAQTPDYARNYSGASFSRLYTLGVRGTF
jgi:outer membrane receptor for ferrienterochelin and colicin